MSIFVLFIGGFQASEIDVSVWLDSARGQRKDVTLDAYPYPAHASYTDVAAVHGFGKKHFKEAVEKITAADADTQVFIVGHSSGCAIANELNSRVPGDHKNITVVDLDGFRVDSSQIKGSKVQLWCAEGLHSKGAPTDWDSIKKTLPKGWDSEQCKAIDWKAGKSRSVNWACDKLKFPSSTATQPWSLHFSMVNKAATDKITNKNYPDEGYAGCVANLCFLPPPS